MSDINMKLDKANALKFEHKAIKHLENELKTVRESTD